MFEKKNLFQLSVLSPFLFNIYMNEFDQLMYCLAFDYIEIIEHNNPKAVRKYHKMIRKFSEKHLYKIIKKQGSVKVLKQNIKNQKIPYYKKYMRTLSIKDGQFIQYVRYVDDFVVGIVGSHNLVLIILEKIDRLLKSKFYLKVKKSFIVR